MSIGNILEASSPSQGFSLVEFSIPKLTHLIPLLKLPLVCKSDQSIDDFARGKERSGERRNTRVKPKYLSLSKTALLPKPPPQIANPGPKLVPCSPLSISRGPGGALY
jgi:hypothetical protein